MSYQFVASQAILDYLAIRWLHVSRTCQRQKDCALLICAFLLVIIWPVRYFKVGVARRQSIYAASYAHIW